MYILNKVKACCELEQYVLNTVADKASDGLRKRRNALWNMDGYLHKEIKQSRFPKLLYHRWLKF